MRLLESAWYKKRSQTTTKRTHWAALGWSEEKHEKKRADAVDVQSMSGEKTFWLSAQHDAAGRALPSAPEQSRTNALPSSTTAPRNMSSHRVRSVSAIAALSVSQLHFQGSLEIPASEFP